MQFEVDNRILELLRAKAEREGVELQELLEAFARGKFKPSSRNKKGGKR